MSCVLNSRNCILQDYRFYLTFTNHNTNLLKIVLNYMADNGTAKKNIRNVV